MLNFSILIPEITSLKCIQINSNLLTWGLFSIHIIKFTSLKINVIVDSWKECNNNNDYKNLMLTLSLFECRGT